METEIWKDIPGFEGLYSVSSIGRVKSLARVVIVSHNRTRRTKEVILKPCKARHGYLSVTLFRNSAPRNLRINRIVALAFIPNPMSLQEVNHKDGVKNNNTVSNLEWCTRKENVNHAINVLGNYRRGIFIRLSKNGETKIMTSDRARLFLRISGERLKDSISKNIKIIKGWEVERIDTSVALSEVIEEPPHFDEFNKWKKFIGAGVNTTVSDLYQYWITNIKPIQPTPEGEKVQEDKKSANEILEQESLMLSIKTGNHWYKHTELTDEPVLEMVIQAMEKYSNQFR